MIDNARQLECAKQLPVQPQYISSYQESTRAPERVTEESNYRSRGPSSFMHEQPAQPRAIGSSSPPRLTRPPQMKQQSVSPPPLAQHTGQIACPHVGVAIRPIEYTSAPTATDQQYAYQAPTITGNMRGRGATSGHNATGSKALSNNLNGGSLLTGGRGSSLTREGSNSNRSSFFD
jgi:hypothetical protein